MDKVFDFGNELIKSAEKAVKIHRKREVTMFKSLFFKVKAFFEDVDIYLAEKGVLKVKPITRIKDPYYSIYATFDVFAFVYKTIFCKTIIFYSDSKSQTFTDNAKTVGLRI